MTQEQLRMQFIGGIISETEFKQKLEESKSSKKKKSLNENFVSIGAINNPFPERVPTDYELAFEHFTKGEVNEEIIEGGSDSLSKDVKGGDKINDPKFGLGVVVKNVYHPSHNPKTETVFSLVKFENEHDDLTQAEKIGGLGDKAITGRKEYTYLPTKEIPQLKISPDINEDTTFTDITQYGWKVHDFLRDMFPEVGEEERMIKILESAIRITKSSIDRIERNTTFTYPQK